MRLGLRRLRLGQRALPLSQLLLQIYDRLRRGAGRQAGRAGRQGEQAGRGGERPGTGGAAARRAARPRAPAAHLRGLPNLGLRRRVALLAHRRQLRRRLRRQLRQSGLGAKLQQRYRGGQAGGGSVACELAQGSRREQRQQHGSSGGGRRRSFGARLPLLDGLQRQAPLQLGLVGQRQRLLRGYQLLLQLLQLLLAPLDLRLKLVRLA